MSGEPQAATQAEPMRGPCVICGAMGYALSMGGPTICPRCDCGDFGYERLITQAAELSGLRSRNAELERLVKAIDLEAKDHNRDGDIVLPSHVWDMVSALLAPKVVG